MSKAAFIYAAATGILGTVGAVAGGIVIGTGAGIVAGGTAGVLAVVGTVEGIKYVYNKGFEDGRIYERKIRTAAELANDKDVKNIDNKTLPDEIKNHKTGKWCKRVYDNIYRDDMANEYEYIDAKLQEKKIYNRY